MATQFMQFISAPGSRPALSKVVDEQEYAEKIAYDVANEAARRKTPMQVLTEGKRYTEMGLLLLPVIFAEEVGWPEDADAMSDLENWWNDQEPRPHRLIRLTPAWNPEIGLRSTPEPMGTV